jgi:hypothetical protein
LAPEPKGLRTLTRIKEKELSSVEKGWKDIFEEKLEKPEIETDSVFQDDAIQLPVFKDWTPEPLDQHLDHQIHAPTQYRSAYQPVLLGQLPSTGW